HIECSAMSRKYLGDTFDIHSGGPDNIFPHHECEIAQSGAVTGKTFVRHWVHCGWVTIGGEKMAKRTGRFHTIPELEEMGYDGADIRLYLIKQHYRAPLPFKLELLDEAKQIRKRINNFVLFEMADRPDGPAGDAIGAEIEQARAAFRAALEDDLNTSEMLAVIHRFMTTVNRMQPSRPDAERAVAFQRELDTVFGILDEAPAATLDEEIERLIAERNAARKAKDFAKADAIRDQLAAQGIELLDTPQGVRWKRS
ncbi:MAG: DALR domain-containing protein, partial [Planctomycetota bacterium]